MRAYTRRGWAHRHRVSPTFLTRKNSHNVFLVLLAGFRPRVFGPWVWRSTYWATTSPLALNGLNITLKLLFLDGIRNPYKKLFSSGPGMQNPEKILGKKLIGQAAIDTRERSMRLVVWVGPDSSLLSTTDLQDWVHHLSCTNLIYIFIFLGTLNHF